MTFNWSKKPFIIGFLYALALCGISFFAEVKLSLPWQPISVIGIAVAFYLGFKNNSSYDRTWEARKIWASTVTIGLDGIRLAGLVTANGAPLDGTGV